MPKMATVHLRAVLLFTRVLLNLSPLKRHEEHSHSWQEQRNRASGRPDSFVPSPGAALPAALKHTEHLLCLDLNT